MTDEELFEYIDQQVAALKAFVEKQLKAKNKNKKD